MAQPQKKLGHKIFNFSIYNDETNSCGTAGCMAGELPILFPHSWVFNYWFGISRKNKFQNEEMYQCEETTEFD